ncbi:MAG: FtsQ-type POTRA domain-containing protein [Actinomycetota bacterium]|nr:FtsQ-type POTRA domain-containing protein [Actinomycetota bacterium]MDQ2959223.1 FtsQ-type POTRA domain-containing protein [Actinomycetota bacterium]
MTELAAGNSWLAAGHRWRWPLAAGVAVLVILLVWLVAFSSVLGVRSVTVSGTKLVSEAQIEKAAAIAPGTPLARLDTAAVRARVAAIPEVRTVTVSTSYPSSVRIEVTERVAVGYRSGPDGTELVDASNVAFRTVAKPPAGLPQLEVSTDQDRAAAAAEVAGSLTPALARKIALISAPSTESVTLKLVDGRTVLWGGVDRSADKARLLPALMGQPGSYFDVSDPSSVISRGA